MSVENNNTIAVWGDYNSKAFYWTNFSQANIIFVLEKDPSATMISILANDFFAGCKGSNLVYKEKHNVTRNFQLLVGVEEYAKMNKRELAFTFSPATLSLQHCKTVFEKMKNKYSRKSPPEKYAHFEKFSTCLNDLETVLLEHFESQGERSSESYQFNWQKDLSQIPQKMFDGDPSGRKIEKSKVLGKRKHDAMKKNTQTVREETLGAGAGAGAGSGSGSGVTLKIKPPKVKEESPPRKKPRLEQPKEDLPKAASSPRAAAGAGAGSGSGSGMMTNIEPLKETSHALAVAEVGMVPMEDEGQQKGVDAPGQDIAYPKSIEMAMLGRTELLELHFQQIELQRLSAAVGLYF